MINPSLGRFVAQVGDTGTDHSFWGRPEQQSGFRPTRTSASADILGSGAAVLAFTSAILSRPGAWQNAGIAANMLARARSLLSSADANPRTYVDSAYSSSVSERGGKVARTHAPRPPRLQLELGRADGPEAAGLWACLG